ncbi:uncharacterized protein LOC121486110 isoform X2 [Vulpes lagopus]|uniref:uncharacterized protein LOC121486110 isoform X2 n=1 Tax=Vulpes lagopus TaxID=494514 RepID=UPI001BC9A76B|nr:uncharacterized protein LOC121486110 isoform X2 [Vulpes lagopus]
MGAQPRSQGCPSTLPGGAHLCSRGCSAALPGVPIRGPGNSPVLLGVLFRAPGGAHLCSRGCSPALPRVLIRAHGGAHPRSRGLTCAPGGALPRSRGCSPVLPGVLTRAPVCRRANHKCGLCSRCADAGARAALGSPRGGTRGRAGWAPREDGRARRAAGGCGDSAVTRRRGGRPCGAPSQPGRGRRPRAGDPARGRRATGPEPAIHPKAPPHAQGFPHDCSWKEGNTMGSTVSPQNGYVEAPTPVPECSLVGDGQQVIPRGHFMTLKSTF